MLVDRACNLLVSSPSTSTAVDVRIVTELHTTNPSNLNASTECASTRPLPPRALSAENQFSAAAVVEQMLSGSRINLSTPNSNGCFFSSRKYCYRFSITVLSNAEEIARAIDSNRRIVVSDTSMSNTICQIRTVVSSVRENFVTALFQVPPSGWNGRSGVCRAALANDSRGTNSNGTPSCSFESRKYYYRLLYYCVE